MSEEKDPDPAAISHVPLVPASPLTPTAPPLVPADQPTAFSWGLAPGGAADAALQPQPQSYPPADVTPPGPPPPPPTAAAHPAPVAPPDEPAIVPWTPPSEVVAALPAAPPPLVEPAAASLPGPAAPAFDFGPPTAAFTVDPDTWSTPPFDPALEGATEALAAEPVGTDLPEHESLAPNALDSLFGESQFREYVDEPLLVPALGATAAPLIVPSSGTLVAQPLVVPQGGERPPRGPIPRTQLVLMWVAGGLAAAIALVGLFVLGTRIAETLGPSPAVVASPDPDATAPALPATGPLPPGDHSWDAMRGGECVEPFESAWQDRYAVVDCATPHAAQLVARATFLESEGAAYPGPEELEARTPELCTAPTAIDYAAVGGITDLQVLASFAADEAEWAEGHRDYFCFAHRSSGEKLTGSIGAPAGP